MNLVQVWVIRHDGWSRKVNLRQARFDTWKGGRVCVVCRLPRLASYLGAADRRAYDRCSKGHALTFSQHG